MKIVCGMLFVGCLAMIVVCGAALEAGSLTQVLLIVSFSCNALTAINFSQSY